MRAKGCLVLFGVILMLAVPRLATAAMLHNFDCTECHRVGLTATQLGTGNVCLRCHTDTGTANMQFVSGDASNHYGNGVPSGDQTSHNWAAASKNSAAGAVEPNTTQYPGFRSQQAATNDKVACSRCHNPHGDSVTNPKLLPLINPRSTTPMTPNAMCIACHKTFADSMQVSHGFLSHPMLDATQLAAVEGDPVKGPKYKEMSSSLLEYNPADPYTNGVQLVNGGISCLSCHGIHFVDSDDEFPDGPSGTMKQGDGLMLRGDGTQITHVSTGLPTGASLCNDCHNYESSLHGGNTVGCLACHGGHNYNNNNPTYYMLNDPTNSYTSLPVDNMDKSAKWGGNQVGVIDGFCESCHGNIEDAAFNGARDHTVALGAEDCTTCHLDHGQGAFSQPIGCDGCHGSPPSVNAPGNTLATSPAYQLNGYAWAPSGNAVQTTSYSYQYSAGDGTGAPTNAFFKDETNTPHTSHAGAASNYKYQCKLCHNTHIDKFATTHNQDSTSFQDVLEPTSPYDSSVVASGAANPSYDDGATTGNCSTVYCHSNGGVNNGTGTRAFGFNNPQWSASGTGSKGSVIGTGNECSFCHGNSTATMTTRGNSNAHQKHLSQGFSCNVCHVSTATGSTALVGAPSSPPSVHINQAVDVAFDTTSLLKAGGLAMSNGVGPWNGSSDTTCDAIYCHSSGQSLAGSRTYRSVNWATGSFPTDGTQCILCHNIPSASQTAAHTAHVNGSTSNVGRDLDCAICHDSTMDPDSNTALGAGGLAFHVNGRVDVKLPASIDPAINCTTSYCHSDGNLDSVTDHSATTNAKYNNPIWTATGGYNACDTCHGNDATNKSYPAYADGGIGTGDANSHNTHVASSLISCEQCHKDTSRTGTSLDGDLPSKHVNNTIDVVFSQGGTFNAGDTCSSTYCHGTGPSPAWGDTSPLACDTCHNASSALANSHGVHYNSATVATAINANNNTTTTKYIFQCGNCHNATTHAGGSVSAVQAAQVSLAGTGTYSAAGVSAGTDRGFSYTAGSCATNDCHNDGTAAKGAPNTVATWTASLPVDCTGCHSNNAAAALQMASGSHTAHVNDGTIMANTACNSCHTVTVDATDRAIADKTRHIDGTRDIDIAATYDSDAMPANNFSANACNNVYCHSDGKSTPTYKSVTWGTTISDCVSCHKGATATSTLSGAHKAHVVNAGSTIGKNLGCVDCHAATVTSNTDIGTPANHVNKAVEVISCATNDCHSNGNFGALVYNIPVFATGSYNCTTCHGNGTVSYPTYADGGTGVNANSHNAHIVGGGYTCVACHSTTSTVGTAIDGSDGTQHVDGGIDVNGTSIGSFGSGTCNAIVCHGDNNATWGDSLGCRDCHSNATTDTDDFVYNNGTFAKVALNEWSYSGHGKLAAAQYDATNRAGADFDTAAGTGDGCLYCHDGGISHSANNGTNNYFRLRDNGRADLNGNCLGCHATGSAGVDPDGATTVFASKNSTVKIDKYHGGALHADPRDAGRWCWDCHDPHGDAAVAGDRIQMIQRNPQVNPNAMGVPASLVDTDIVFTDNTTGAAAGSFAMTAAPFKQGICNSCHTTTAQYTQTLGANVHPTGQCTICHQHSSDTTYDGNAFKGSGCNGCHGNSTTGNYWPDSTAGAAMLAANDAGRHDKHIEVLALEVYGQTPAQLLADAATDDKQRNLCTFCHNTPGADGDHGFEASLPADVNSMKQMWGAYGGDNGVFDPAGDTNKGTCATTDCHNNKTNPSGYSWYGATGSACIMCHADVTVSSGAGSTGQTHVAHSGAALTYGRAGLCADCHDPATDWSTNTKPAVNHINGAFVVGGGNVTLTYSGATYPTVKGTCGTTECHNSGRNAAPVVDPTWGTTMAGCGSCHPFVPGQGHTPHFDSSGTFVSSFPVLAGGIGCTVCHTHAGNNATHINAKVTISAAMNYNSAALNLDVVQTPDYGTCNTQICHQDGKGTAAITPFWNRTPQSSDDCTLCHFNAAPASTVKHDEHIGLLGVSSYTTAATNASTATEYRFNCANCHGNTLSNHLNTSNWASPGVSTGVGVTVDAGVNYTIGAQTCNNNACHTNGTGGAANLTANWSTGWVADGDSDTCNNCHGNSPTSNAHQVHAVGIHAEDIYSGTTGLLSTATATKSHGDPVTSTTINCNLCHSQTVTMARNKFGSECVSCHSADAAGTVMGVADKSKHVDGSKQVVFAMTSFKSKAQLRDDITTVPELDNNWTRTDGYKAAASFDQVKLTTTPVYASGPKTCSTVDCHNGITATWAAPANNCMACHTSLPK